MCRTDIDYSKCAIENTNSKLNITIDAGYEHLHEYLRRNQELYYRQHPIFQQPVYQQPIFQQPVFQQPVFHVIAFNIIYGIEMN